MRVKVKVASSLKFPVKEFEMIEESDGLEISVDVKDEKELDKEYKKWQDYINKKVIQAAFKAANNYLEAKKNL